MPYPKGTTVTDDPDGLVLSYLIVTSVEGLQRGFRTGRTPLGSPDRNAEGELFWADICQAAVGWVVWYQSYKMPLSCTRAWNV